MKPKTYEDFKKLAVDYELSLSEKIDFPDKYRVGYENLILQNILKNIPELNLRNQLVLDIGCGCQFVKTLYDFCYSRKDTLVLVDSDEMLSLVPDRPRQLMYPGKFPDIPVFSSTFEAKINVIIAYSVLQYVYEESNVFHFIDGMLPLLADGGKILLGDVPNISKANRFFISDAGIEYHRKNNNTDELPKIESSHGKINDSVVMNILAKYRAIGYDVYVVPQNQDLAMSNRREDILICKN